jgi:hypothetical protein
MELISSEQELLNILSLPGVHELVKVFFAIKTSYHRHSDFIDVYLANINFSK